jgi:small subunit ribosomal protein S6
MAKPAPVYDLNVMLDVDLPEETRESMLADIEAMVAADGEIVSTHDWGRRKMAYEIRHKGEAEYHLIQFNGPRALLERLDRTLRITDGVIRYRIIKLDAGTPDPPDLRGGTAAPPTAAPPAPAAEPVDAA